MGNNEDAPRYDIMNAIVINISKVHDTGGTQNELIRLLTDLFDERLNGAEKVEKLADEVDRLNYDLSIAGTDEFYERYARIRLGYYHYGDVIYVTDEK